MIQVMLSSTVKDLRDDRQAVLDALGATSLVQVIGAEPVPQAPVARSPYLATVEMAERCHLYVLILAGRYGHEPQDGKSATELEFDAAYDADPTKVLVFKKRVPRTEAKQRQLIQRVGSYYSGFWMTKYRAADELSDLVTSAFEAWIKERAAIGFRLTYFDHFLRAAVQRTPVPGVRPQYSVTPDFIELSYSFFGNEHVVHFAKSKILDDFWGCLARLDQTFRTWRG